VKKTAPLIALSLAACATQPIQTPAPIGIGRGVNDLQASPCNCGGLESEENHKERQKRKEEAAKTGAVNTDIVKDDR
tara:strand:- start:1222 stop:1452 length:231 start_codon:yes stop_codon:yes gene_type:complete